MRVRPSLLLGTVALSWSAAGVAMAQERHAYIVVDPQTQQVLYESNAQARRFPASITKVMTVYMIFEAIEQGRLNWDSQITFSRNASRQPPTKLGVAPGGSISVEDAVNALIIRSANDVATAVAENLAGSEAAFARQMTERARTLGMSRTQFRNASGLPDSNQYSTAEDLARLSIAIRRDFPQHFHMFSRTQFTYGGTVIQGHNRVMTSVDGVDGLKTGYTRASGFNLATTAGRDNQRLVTVVLGGTTSEARNTEVTNLVETGFNALGVRRYVMDVARPDATGLADRRDAGDLLALSSEVPVAVHPSAPVVLAGLGRSDRSMGMPAGTNGWQPPTTFAALQPTARTVASNLPVAQPSATRPGIVMTAADMGVIGTADRGEDGAEEAGSVMMAAVAPAAASAAVASAAPVQTVEATNSGAQTAGVATVQLAASFPPEPMPAAVALRGTDRQPDAVETSGGTVSPVLMAATSTGVASEATPSPPETLETQQPASVQLAMATPDPGLPPPVTPEAVLTAAAPTVTFTVPAFDVAGLAETGATPTNALTSGDVPGSSAQPSVLMAENTIEPWVQPVEELTSQTSEPAGPSAAPQAASRLVGLQETDPSAIIFNADTSVLPVAESATVTSTDGQAGAPAAAQEDAGAQAIPPIQMAALDAGAVTSTVAEAASAAPIAAVAADLSAEALAVTETMRREAAARESARLAAIEAEEARMAAAARAAREAQARERQLAAQRARELRERQLAEQQTRATREREVAERREREQAAAEEAANQRRLAAMRGTSGVQIGAYRSEQDARAALRAGSRFAPSVARGEVSRVETSEGVFFRARFVGLAASAARALCGQITSGGASKQCLILGN
jgi:D-alanyl-D-alanine carboxypeptidase